MCKIEVKDFYIPENGLLKGQKLCCSCIFLDPRTQIETRNSPINERLACYHCMQHTKELFIVFYPSNKRGKYICKDCINEEGVI